MRELELLAPAKNLECGIAAIDHGADAVYIGASRFGARVAAGNSIEDIRSLCTYAHKFAAKVYVTLNTIVYDSEINDLHELVKQLADAGADAFLLQDMGLFSLCREWLAESGYRVALHASTQTHNYTVEKVKWLYGLGFERVVLARELSLPDIKRIHDQVPEVEIEAFVHGALCVSFSGQCYASQHCFGRSANRGECAQFCRLEFSVEDADGKQVAPPAHWLSLKDMCRIEYLGEMAEAGVCSFKIEGRLKDVGYVKNVVAAYNKRLDELVAKHPDKYRRSSLGRVALSFDPDVKKSFNRGFTPFFLDIKPLDIASTATPKAIGTKVGKVIAIKKDYFIALTEKPLSNGDGLCFFNKAGQLEGFRVNKVQDGKVFPLKMPKGLCQNMTLYRNFDQDFERSLSKPTAQRRIPLCLKLSSTQSGFMLQAEVPDTELSVAFQIEMQRQQAKTPQLASQREQLSRLGQTIYMAETIEIDDDVSQCFIPSSQLAACRRQVIALMDNLILKRIESHVKASDGEPSRPSSLPRNPSYPRPSSHPSLPSHPSPSSPDLQARFPYLHNVSNGYATTFYQKQGIPVSKLAYELSGPEKGALLMQCRYCVRYAMGYCVRHGGKKPSWKEPLSLALPDGRKFRLEFHCSSCQMYVYAQN